MKTILKLLFCCVFMLCTGTAKVNAQESSTSIKGSELSEACIDLLKKAGVTVRADSIIELTPIIDGSKRGNVIVTTNHDGNKIRRDYTVITAPDGNCDIDDVTQLTAVFSYSQSASYPPLSWDGRYIVNATAYFDRYTYQWTSTWYRPLSVSFSLTKYSNSANVSSIMVKYITTGYEYSYPGFTDLGTTANHIITVSVPYPNTEITYSQTNAYSSSKVIYTGTGYNNGSFITFFNTVNGVLDTYTVHF